MARRGFTLIEILIFIAVFSLVMEGVVTLLLSVTRVQSNQSSVVNVETQGQFLLQQIQRKVQAARLVDMTQDVATGTLKLRETTSSEDPTVIDSSSSTAYLTEGSGSPQALTTQSVVLSNLSFTRHYNIGSSSAYGVDSVNFSFTLAENTSNTTKEYTASFQSSASVTVPIGKIAMLQQANASGQSLTSVSFTDANETGSLLIAVASILNNSSATISISDTAGNSWSEVANTSYPAYNEQIGIFAAPDAKNANDTVNLSLTTTTSNETRWLSIYEYRGAATSSPFDASAAALQPATTTPSSGPAYPASSTAELVLGVVYSDPFTTAPAAGSGFTVETTSTYSATSVEDANVFITGGVSADWQYSQVTSSTAAVATFR